MSPYSVTEQRRRLASQEALHAEITGDTDLGDTSKSPPRVGLPVESEKLCRLHKGVL
jgi:hypothetical protein